MGEAKGQAKSSEKPVPTVQVTIDTVATKGLVKVTVPKTHTVDDVVAEAAKVAQQKRVKGGRAFGQMVEEGYQAVNAATNKPIDSGTQVSRHAEKGKAHYKVNPAGENGYDVSYEAEQPYTS